ncbi:hypothetical protein [Fodinicola acaciae]|uniref:hypothetical protein n=1 Tax=Fodinicola acaciae TaxID=2681555 RepID=UPI0013D73497|nr:hypothetical protein [Fodinicola acaciae]
MTRVVRSAARGAAGDSGSAAVEAVAAMLVVVIVFGVFLAIGRAAIAGHIVQTAAERAARAATVVRTKEAAREKAIDQAGRTFNEHKHVCIEHYVDVDLGSFQPGGLVTVHVRCIVGLADLDLPGVPGTVVFTATGISGIDVYRAGS